MSNRVQTLPPTLGCGEPEPQAAGLVANAPQPLRGTRVVTCNSGFGGVNVALVLEAA